jgi:hypothetical protein
MTHPSCFGLPSVFVASSPACVSCTSREQCVPACHQLLVSLSDKMDVSGNLAQLERTAKVVIAQSLPATTVETTIAAPARAALSVNLSVDAHMQSTLDRLPVNAAKILKPLLTRGADVKARYSLANDRNPFDTTTPRWLQLAGEGLLAGGFTKAELRERYIKEFGWGEGTAFSRVSVVAAVLPALRLATAAGNRIIRAPSIVGKN